MPPFALAAASGLLSTLIRGETRVALRVVASIGRRPFTAGFRLARHGPQHRFVSGAVVVHSPVSSCMGVYSSLAMPPRCISDSTAGSAALKAPTHCVLPGVVKYRSLRVSHAEGAANHSPRLRFCVWTHGGVHVACALQTHPAVVVAMEGPSGKGQACVFRFGPPACVRLGSWTGRPSWTGGGRTSAHYAGPWR